MLKASAGKPFQVELAATPTTGYAWELAAAPDGVQLLGSHFTPPTSAVPGAGGTQVFELQAARPGHLSLQFVLKRSWEPEPARRETVEVEVD